LARSLALSSAMVLKKMSAGISATVLSLELEGGLGRHRQRNPGDGLRGGALLQAGGFKTVAGLRLGRSLRGSRGHRGTRENPA